MSKHRSKRRRHQPRKFDDYSPFNQLDNQFAGYQGTPSEMQSIGKQSPGSFGIATEAKIMELARLQDKCVSIAQRLVNMRKEHEKLENGLVERRQGAARTFRKLRGQINALRHQKKQADEDFAHIYNRIDAVLKTHLQGTILTLQEQIEEHTTRLEQTRQKQEAVVAEAQQRLSDMEKQYNLVMQMLDTAKENTRILEQEQDAALAERNAAGEAREQLQQDVDDKLKVKTEVESKIVDLTQRLEELQRRTEEERRNLPEHVLKAIADDQADIQRWRTRLNELESTLEKRLEITNQLDADLTKREAVVKEKESEIRQVKSLARKMGDRAKNLDEREKKLATNRKLLTTRRRNLNSRGEELDLREEKLDELDKELSSKQRSLTRRERQVKKLETTAASRSTAAKYEKRIDQLKEQLQAALAHLHASKLDIKDQRRALRDKDKELARARKSLRSDLLKLSSVLSTSKIVHDWLWEAEGEVFALPDNIVAVGERPFDHGEFNAFLDSQGTSVCGPGDEEAGCMVVGRDAWSEDDLEQQIRAREGSTLKIYSQEMLLAAIVTKRDPFLEDDNEVLVAFAENHPALEYLTRHSITWPEISMSVMQDFSLDMTIDVEESPLHKMGYRVGIHGEALSVRRRLLRQAFEKDLPWVHSDEYMNQWGGADSPRRLWRIAVHLRKMVYVHRKLGHDHAVEDWAEDSSWLYDQFYGSRMRFDWPDIDV